MAFKARLAVTLDWKSKLPLCIAAAVWLAILPNRLLQAQDLASTSGFISTLQGRLETSSGKPLIGISLQLYSWGGELAGTGETGPDGEFSFAGLPEGVYSLQGVHEGRAFSETIQHQRGFTSHEVRLRNRPPAGLRDAALISVNDLQTPNRARSSYKKAAKALLENKPDQAMHWIEQTIATAPRWAQAHFFRGALLLRNGLYAQAQQSFEAAADADPSNSAILAALAATHYEEAQIDRAEFYANRAVALAPPSWQAYYVLSLVSYHKGRYPEAIAEARKAIVTDASAAPECHLVIAESDVKLHQWPGAEQELGLYLADAEPGPVPDQARKQLEDVKHLLAAPASTGH